MKQHLENLRARPDHVKRKIAFFSSLGITLVIFLFWVVSFSIQTSSQVAEANNENSSIQSPAASLSANVADAWASLKTVISGSTKTNTSANNSIEVVPGNR